MHNSKKLHQSNIYYFMTLFSAFTFMLNVSNKLYHCSFIFVALLFVVNQMGNLFGKREALKLILASVGINFIFLAQSIDIMVTLSLLSLLLSVIFVLKFNRNNNLFVFLGAALMDTIIVTMSLSLPLEKLLSIGSTDFAYKFMYILAIRALISFFSHLQSSKTIWNVN